jgi:hypothetical protein
MWNPRALVKFAVVRRPARDGAATGSAAAVPEHLRSQPADVERAPRVRSPEITMDDVHRLSPEVLGQIALARGRAGEFAHLNTPAADRAFALWRQGNGK